MQWYNKMADGLMAQYVMMAMTCIVAFGEVVIVDRLGTNEREQEMHERWTNNDEWTNNEWTNNNEQTIKWTNNKLANDEWTNDELMMNKRQTNN